MIIKSRIQSKVNNAIDCFFRCNEKSFQLLFSFNKYFIRAMVTWFAIPFSTVKLLNNVKTNIIIYFEYTMQT